MWLAEMVKTASSKPRGVTGEIQGLRLLSQLQDLPCTAGASELLRFRTIWGLSGLRYLGPGDGLENLGQLARNKYIALKKKNGRRNKVWIYSLYICKYV